MRRTRRVLLAGSCLTAYCTKICPQEEADAEVVHWLEEVFRPMPLGPGMAGGHSSAACLGKVFEAEDSGTSGGAEQPVPLFFKAAI